MINSPRADHGFFGPDSPSWRVWAHPAAFIGFQRAVTIETLDPFLTAAVETMRGVYTNPGRRFDRTAEYFLTIAMGDSPSAIAAARVLHRVHCGVVGPEPVSGRRFDANDPASQLWIHMTAWHSMLYCYERFGPGRLSEADEAQYWKECAIAAEMQTIEPGTVPTSREGVRRYFAEQQPRLALSVAGRGLFMYFLRPGFRRDAKLHTIAWRMSTSSTIATMPRWMRRLAGLHVNPVRDAVAIVLTKLLVRAMTPLPVLLFMLDRLSPSTSPVIVEALRGPEPIDPRVVTPAEAKERYGDPHVRAARGTLA